MTIDEIKWWIGVIDIIIAVLSFGFVGMIAATNRPQKLLLRTFEEISIHLKKSKNSLLDYKKLREFLLRNGADFHFGRWIGPINYTMIRVIMCAIGLFLGSFYEIWLGLIMGIIFFMVPDMLLVWMNGKDNEKMIPELKLVYSSISMQIKSGIHITDALSECYGSIQRGRLREALHHLSSDILMNANVERALGEFQGRFDNRYIDSLCITVLQSLESGQALDLLADIAEQIKDLESSVMSRKKGSLDRSITFYQLGILVAILVVVIYACITYMMKTAFNF